MPDPFQDKTILVALTGGIACYKTATLVSRLTQAGAAVTVCMTEAATRFVAPLTLQALSGRPVYTSPWEHIESQDPQHIATARRADLMIVAPCTMNMLSKLATGRADDIVCLVAAAMSPKRQPILLAPAMNEAMWEQASTQRNVEQLREDGLHFVGPGSGWQACRTMGIGRMSEPEEVLAAAEQLLTRA
jgi:phosphopantothenoylcysteine decarboxylase/phosphopantothenate--cysteine ligase